MSTDRETKVCPDCAEEVLAAARKCRFCGYRFDAPPPPPPRPVSGGGSLLDLLRTPRAQVASVPELVRDWGVPLWPDEVVREDGLCFVEIGSERGYALVTSSRFRFVMMARGRRSTPEVRIDHQLSDLRAATVVRRRLRRAVVLRWPDEETVVHVETGPPEKLVELVTS